MISRDGAEACNVMFTSMTDTNRTLRKIAETMPQPAWTCLPDGSCDFLNDSGLQYTGQSREESKGWGWGRSFKEDDLQKLMSKVRPSLETGDEISHECPIYHAPSQEYRWNSIHGIAFRDDQGSIDKWFGTWTDIHDSRMAQQHVKKKEAQLELLVKNLPAIVWLAGADGNPDFISSQWARYTGIDWSVAKNRLEEFAHPADFERCKNLWQAALEKKTKFETEIRLKHAPDYQYLWNLAKVEPIFDEEKQLKGWIGTILDVNAQKEAEALLQLVIDSIPGLIWWKDQDSKYLGCNMKLAVKAGLSTPAEVVGKSDYELPWKDQARQFATADRRVMDTNTADYHIIEPIQASDGKMSWLDTSKVPLHDAEGNVVGSVGNSVDITTIVRLTEQREDFMASLAHDLKVPIVGAIRAFDVLTAGMVGPLSDDQIAFVNKLHQSHEHLLSLIQNLLQVLRYEASADELQIARCDLTGVFRSSIADLQAMAKDKQIDVQENYQNETIAMADHLAMKRLVMNLVGNAIKFTPRGGRIKVSLGEHENNVLISVSDTGAGISREDQKRLFQRFWQGGTVKKYAAETGLGLYLCRQIAEGHGGTITVESDEGDGATFIVVFPRNGPQSQVDMRLEA